MEYGFAGERRLGWKGTAGEKANNPLNACEGVMTSRSSVSKKNKITSCQTSWVTFVMEPVTERSRESIFRGKSKRFGDPGDPGGSSRGTSASRSGLAMKWKIVPVAPPCTTCDFGLNLIFTPKVSHKQPLHWNHSTHFKMKNLRDKPSWMATGQVRRPFQVHPWNSSGRWRWQLLERHQML